MQELTMAISLYDVTIPMLSTALSNLDAILDKAIAHATAKKIDAKVLPDTRLIADMMPLSRQIQTACDSAKGAAARLAGIDIPKHEDNETTLPELKARIAKALAFINTVKPDQLTGAESREITLTFPGKTLKFTGQSYVTTFVIPNFFFHVTMAYALLRQNGVDIGKLDYIGKLE
jgi:hypothetical protein